MVNNIIAIIPARGGSKRIPKKNIVFFRDKPMIAWTIEAALESKLFKAVYVDTDCSEIAEVARKYGAEVPFLRDNFTDDFSTVSQSSAYFLGRLINEGIEVDYVIQLMANCPLRSSETIQSSFSYFMTSDNDFQISCFKYGWMNPRWALSLTSEGVGTRVFNDDINKRSQDLEELYCPTGAIWIGRAKSLLNFRNFYLGKVSYFEIDWKEALDIDNYEDLEMGKAISILFK